MTLPATDSVPVVLSGGGREQGAPHTRSPAAGTLRATPALTRAEGLAGFYNSVTEVTEEVPLATYHALGRKLDLLDPKKLA